MAADCSSPATPPSNALPVSSPYPSIEVSSGSTTEGAEVEAFCKPLIAAANFLAASSSPAAAAFFSASPSRSMVAIL